MNRKRSRSVNKAIQPLTPVQSAELKKVETTAAKQTKIEYISLTNGKSSKTPPVATTPPGLLPFEREVVIKTHTDTNPLQLESEQHSEPQQYLSTLATLSNVDPTNHYIQEIDGEVYELVGYTVETGSNNEVQFTQILIPSSMASSFSVSASGSSSTTPSTLISTSIPESDQQQYEYVIEMNPNIEGLGQGQQTVTSDNTMAVTPEPAPCKAEMTIFEGLDDLADGNSNENHDNEDFPVPKIEHTFTIDKTMSEDPQGQFLNASGKLPGGEKKIQDQSQKQANNSEKKLEKNIMCSYCSECFHHSCELVTHSKKFHFDERPHKCPYCPLDFKTQKSVELHISIHGRIPTYKCRLCSEAFHRQNELDVHERMHWNKQSFRCPLDKCRIIFSSRKSLNLHIQEKHGDELFLCTICNKAFISQSRLNDHFQARHCEDKPFKCQYCKLEFNLKTYLLHHLRKVHGKERRKYFNGMHVGMK